MAELQPEPEPEPECCPITRLPLREPVMCGDGYVYERWAIQAWLDTGARRSPMTNLPMTSVQLRPVGRAAEPEPEPEYGAGDGVAPVELSYLSWIKPAHLMSGWPSLPSPLPSFADLPRMDSYHLLPRRLSTRDRWTLIELSAAYVGLNRSRRVRVARQLDQHKTTVLGSLYDYYGWTCGVLKETVAARLPGTPTAVTSLLSRDYLAAISRLQTSLQSASLIDSLGVPLRSVSVPLVRGTLGGRGGRGGRGW